MSSFKAEVIADSSGQWTSNTLRFATEAEALGYVAHLYAIWAAVRQTRVVGSDDPVTSSWPVGRPTPKPLPRLNTDLEVTPITDVDAFIAELTMVRTLMPSKNRPGLTDPDEAFAELRQAIEAQDIEAYWTALSDLHDSSARTGKLPRRTTSMQPTDEDRRIDPDVEIIGDQLQALIDIQNACHRLGWRGEWHLCEGLLLELAFLLEGETSPNSATHKLAAALIRDAGMDTPPTNEPRS
jgi:hypothetical protein